MMKEVGGDRQLAQQRDPVLDHGGAHEHGAVEELGGERVDERGVHEVDVVAVRG